MKKYRINEIFYSIQGEGVRAGTANIFVRFSGCNLKCAADDEFSGFNCDTEFTSGQNYELDDLLAEIVLKATDHVINGQKTCKAVILTGGEPSLQIDQDLIEGLHRLGFYIAIESNGTKELPEGIDWITISPKSAEHTIKQPWASELKYVRHSGQGIPRPIIVSEYKLISPAFDGHRLPKENLEHCMKLVKDNPEWRLSIQLHNFLGVR